MDNKGLIFVDSENINNTINLQILIDIWKSKKSSEFAKKKPLFLEVILGFTKSSVSLFPLFSKTSPSHTYTLCHLFLFRGMG